MNLPPKNNYGLVPEGAELEAMIKSYYSKGGTVTRDPLDILDSETPKFVPQGILNVYTKSEKIEVI